MKSKKIILLIVVIIAIAVLGIIIWKSFLVKNDGDNFVETTSEILNSDEPEKVIATVNGEEIKEKDINYKELVHQGINETLNIDQKNTDFESLKKEVIIDKILLQEARKNNIDIDEEEKNSIEEMSKQAMNQTDEEIAKKIGMTKEEYLQYYIEKQIESRVIEKMREEIIIDIAKGNVHIDDAEFKQNMQKLTDEKEFEKKGELLQKAYDSYINYLIKNSEIS